MFISRLLASARSRAGFTMIELLVVIAVIGVLAVAVLSSINPIEQINKGRDTRTRSDSAQLINALDRFYAIQEMYPWNMGIYNGGTDEDPSIAFPASSTATCTDVGQFCLVGGYTQATTPPWLTALATTEEVKDSFISRLATAGANNGIYLYKSLNGDLYACFDPASQQFKLEAAQKCATDAVNLTGYPSEACDTTDGTVPTAGGERNLICLP